MTEQNQFEYLNVWKSKTPELAQEIVEFWLEEKAISSKQAARKRLPQVVHIAKNSSGKIAGLCSIFEQYSARLDNYFYFYRTFIAPPARRSRVAEELLVKTTEFLESRFVDRATTRCIGVMLQIESQILKVNRNQAVWSSPDSHINFVYIGKNRKGDHQRVYYFKDARIS